MKKLLEQIIKFGLVGVLCTLIDFGITMAVSAVLRRAGMNLTNAALAGGLLGFTVSLVVNYFLSMKFVFTRKEGLDRRKEFLIFLVLSLVGCGLNELIIKGSLWVIELRLPALMIQSAALVTAIAKIMATGVVMIYNFVTRKLFLEEKA